MPFDPGVSKLYLEPITTTTVSLDAWYFPQTKKDEPPKIVKWPFPPEAANEAPVDFVVVERPRHVGWAGWGALKARWIEAMRSGKHYQIRHQFSNFRGGYCALGLLYLVAAIDFGINRTTAELMIAQRAADIIMLNDGQQWSFPQIADWVEQYL
jgi:hypothetical protein